MVAVEVLLLHTVVHAMVRRRVEHLLGHTEPIDGLGVDPELVDEVDRSGVIDELGPHTEEREHAVGDEHPERLTDRLTERGGEVVVLTRVVHDVDRPHPSALVLETMVPVVEEVPSDDRGRPGEHAGAEIAVRTVLAPQPCRARTGLDGGGAGEHASGHGGHTGRRTHSASQPRQS